MCVGRWRWEICFDFRFTIVVFFGKVISLDTGRLMLMSIYYNTIHMKVQKILFQHWVLSWKFNIYENIIFWKKSTNPKSVVETEGAMVYSNFIELKSWHKTDELLNEEN